MERNEPLYAKYRDGRHWELHPTVYAERFARLLGHRDFSGCVLDVGCGNGRDVGVFADLGFDAIGIDLSADEIGYARAARPDCKFEVADAAALPFDDGTFGAAFAINVIHYVDARKALAEIRRVLGPKGVLLLHVNLDITDAYGIEDLRTDEAEVDAWLEGWKELKRLQFERIDSKPVEHQHVVLELILEKLG